MKKFAQTSDRAANKQSQQAERWWREFIEV